jgi:hypothetical protein
MESCPEKESQSTNPPQSISNRESRSPLKENEDEWE